MASFQGELEEKMERFELNLRTLSEAKRKYSVEGLFGWIRSPRSAAEDEFDPFPRRVVEEELGQEVQDRVIQLQEHEEHEESICVEDHLDQACEDVAVPEDTVDELANNDLVSISETSFSTVQTAEELSLPKPTTKTEVAIHNILSGMMDTVNHLAVSNKKMQSDHQENESLRMDRKLRRRQSRMLTRMPSVDIDVDTAMGECTQSSPKAPVPMFDAEFPRVMADSSVMRKPAVTGTQLEPVDEPFRSKRKRALGPYTQVKVSASESEDTTFTENSGGTTPSIYYKEYRPSKLRPYPELNGIGRRLSDEAIGRHRRVPKRRQVAAAPATSSPDESPRAVVELFLNPCATGGSGGAGAHSSASDEQVTPTPMPRMSWRTEPKTGSDAKRPSEQSNAKEQSTSKEQSTPREVSPRVPIHRRPKPSPTPAVDAPSVRQRISWRSDAVIRPKATPAMTSLADSPAPAPVEVDTKAVPARRPRLPRRKIVKPTEVEEVPVEQVVEPEHVEPEVKTQLQQPVPDNAATTAPVQRGRGNHTRERQLRWQRRQEKLAVRSLADEVAAHVRAQRQWLRSQKELGGEDANLTRSYELPTVSSVMKRVVKSYMSAVGMSRIPFVVGTSTSPTHHCGLKKQAELGKFKLQLPNKLGHYSSTMTKCTESESTTTNCCPAAVNAGRSSSSYGMHASQRPEDRWAEACTEPNCTCCVRKTQPADKVLHQYKESRTQVKGSPSFNNRAAGSRLDLSTAIAATTSTATLPIAGSVSNTASVLSKTDLHGESLQTLKVKIRGLKECLMRLQDRFKRLHEMRDNAELDLNETQIADLDRKIVNKEQEINVVLGLMREIFALSRSQKTSVVSMAESTRSRRSGGVVSGRNRLPLRRK